MKFLRLILFISFLFISCNDDAVTPNLIIDQRLEAAYNKAKLIPYIKSLLVQKDNELIGEQYFNAEANNTFDVRSVTKSVVSVLTGIAIEKGYLENINQTLNDFFPELTDEKANISIKNLLTMTAGFEADEFVSMKYYIDWAYSGDPFNYALSNEIIHSPGTQFHYYSAVPYIMGKIIEQVSGKNLFEFAEEHLFKPMEFSSPKWEILDGGGFNGGAGLQLTARDMVKFGQMIVDGGVYKNKKIVNSEWIEESTKRHYYTYINAPYEKEYGYYWWILPNTNEEVFFANGYAGNFIFCCPSLNLIITASSDWEAVAIDPRSDNWNKVARLIINDILPIYFKE